MKPALSAARATSVVNYFTVNPDRSFSQAELAGVLGMSPTSLSPVLLALTDAGYLVRHPKRKTFEIGPTLVAVGRAAARRHPIIELARPAMARLAELGSECVGTAMTRNSMTILAVEGAPAANARELRVGQQLPIVWPYGGVFHSWDDAHSARTWLKTALPVLTPQIEAAWERSMRANRARGYVVALESDTVARVQALIDEAAANPGNAQIRAQLLDLIPRQAEEPYYLDEVVGSAAYTVTYIAAPIFDADGRFIYALSVLGIGTARGDDIERIGQAVSRECRALTRQVGGITPASD